MIRSLVALAITIGMASTASAVDSKYFEIKKVTVTDVTAQYAQSEIMAKQPGFLDDCGTPAAQIVPRFASDAASFNPVESLNVVDVVVDQIINIGKKIFAVIAQGKPVVNVKVDTANALPAGLTCWSDLSGWNIPQTKVYNVQYENGFGMTVVDFSYRLTFTAGGSANGVGKYITNATFMPANLSVAWGFSFDANAVVPTVLNTGSRTSPVAGMQMNMAWKVNSLTSHEEGTETYFASGANKLTELK